MKREDSSRRWRPRWLPATALALALGALVLAGCGGSGGSSESSTTASSSESNSTRKFKGGFELSEEAKACLKEKGVELPEFKGGAGGPPQGGEGFEPPEGGEMPRGAPPQGGFKANSKAFEECGVELGEFKGPIGKGGPDVNSAEFKKQIKEYVACVRENGYELAEPNFSGEGPIFEKSESESEAFKRASAKCQSLLGRLGAQPPSSAQNG
jgi:hypothetical protein